MITLRCTEKLLKRFKQPKPVEAAPCTNPLGEWYGAIDSYDREPFLLMLNAQTGITLVLPARANQLKEINFYAAVQLALLFEHYGIQSPLAEAELLAWQQPIQFAKTQSRSLLTSMNRLRDDTWDDFEHHDLTYNESAARQWLGLFKKPGEKKATAWTRPIQNLYACFGISPPHMPDHQNGRVFSTTVH